MCGICAILNNSQVCDNETLIHDFLQTRSRLDCRGPDKTHHSQLQLSNGKTAFLSGHVLHFRGNQLVHQPTADDKGNQLLWNGEVYDGIEVKTDECDTVILLQHLAHEDSDDNVVSTMSQIVGPWSFIYWQANTETLWFGRDVFGRRSLLWHLPEGDLDPFILSSIRILPWQFLEVPSVGLYKVCLKESISSYTVTVIPWQRAVWPGSLDVVENNSEFSQRVYSGKLSVNMSINLDEGRSVVSHMPEICKSLPSPDYKLLEMAENQSYLEYLQELSKSDRYLQTLSRQLTNVLLEAVRVRVFNQHKLDNLQEQKSPNQNSKPEQKYDSSTHLLSSASGEKTDPAFEGRCEQFPQTASRSYEGKIDSHTEEIDEQFLHSSNATVAILFSGGIDSTILAALADRCLPPDEEIDLLNVAFEMKQKENPTNKKKRTPDLPQLPDMKWNVPDRLTGYTALSELNPDRKWNFVEVNVTATELQQARQSHIEYLLHPLQTVLDDSIGCAVWFAARGYGVLGNGRFKGSRFRSKAKVILCGMGADEQLVGYSRHRVRFKQEGWEGLLNEIQLEITRLSARNLGRDDRIITDHGRESRLPYLDENVVKFLSEIPVYQKANLTLPRGLGEKLLLRLSAYDLGLFKTSTLPKRAIQFGSRIAKLENSKEKASDRCDRLSNVQTE